MAAEPSTVSAWEDAYIRFETPAEEIAKFQKRLNRFNQQAWARDTQIVELFCGSGRGLVALESLGFKNLTGIDISPRLLQQYEGCGKTITADCRSIPLPDNKFDIAIVQGGLHHLQTLKKDLPTSLKEVNRILKPGGRFYVVEPWLTPFLKFVHFVTLDFRLFNRISGKFSAFHDMVRLEEDTYIPWLSSPNWIKAEFLQVFDAESVKIGWGKLSATYRTRTRS
jgi:ubiquinone/menaquinone biosynthesis C-methylase UbiE